MRAEKTLRWYLRICMFKALEIKIFSAFEKLRSLDNFLTWLRFWDANVRLAFLVNMNNFLQQVELWRMSHEWRKRSLHQSFKLSVGWFYDELDNIIEVPRIRQLLFSWSDVGQLKSWTSFSICSFHWFELFVQSGNSMSGCVLRHKLPLAHSF